MAHVGDSFKKLESVPTFEDFVVNSIRWDKVTINLS